MAKIEIVPKDALNVSVKVDELVKGQQFPFRVTLNHDHKRGIILPRIGHPDTILAKTDTLLTLNSFEQAWELCSDLAHLAEYHKRESFCSLAAPEATEQAKGNGKSTKGKEA